jgi:hypothetical protein
MPAGAKARPPARQSRIITFEAAHAHRARAVSVLDDGAGP